ncbi:hypothetical protein BD311DRAFT_769550 [Dichomitus squalens]|uniref:Uncharacterized protein n=1 Tax=Dichomitus squalens TaxID=114155 RepID=A0A4Q9MAE3_9APHY|nr:hypothetical protein BD311DRAFT_769550 [Dichomitus squalens]
MAARKPSTYCIPVVSVNAVACSHAKGLGRGVRNGFQGGEEESSQEAIYRHLISRPNLQTKPAAPNVFCARNSTSRCYFSLEYARRRTACGL